MVCPGGLWSCSQFQRQYEGVANWRLPKEKDLKGATVHVDHILIDLPVVTLRFQFSWANMFIAEFVVLVLFCGTRLVASCIKQFAVSKNTREWRECIICQVWPCGLFHFPQNMPI